MLLASYLLISPWQAEQDQTPDAERALAEAIFPPNDDDERALAEAIFPPNDDDERAVAEGISPKNADAERAEADEVAGRGPMQSPLHSIPAKGLEAELEAARQQGQLAGFGFSPSRYLVTWL